MADSTKKSGIYQIRNVLDGALYIGSTNSFINRKGNHFRLLRQNSHFNIHLQRAFNKYSEVNFVFEILEYCDVTELLEIEQMYLNRIYDPLNIVCYNVDKFVNKQEISAETRHKMSAKSKGRKHTQEVKNIIRKAMLGNKHSAGVKRTKQHISVIKKVHSKPVLQFDKEGLFIKEWESQTEAAKTLLLSNENISSVCRGKRQTAGGFVWRNK